MKFVKRFKWRIDRLLSVGDEEYYNDPWKGNYPHREYLNPTNGFSSEEEAVEALNLFGYSGKYTLVAFYIPEDWL